MAEGSVSEAIKALQKLYGKDALFFAGSAADRLSIPRLSTGCLPIDIATNGGLPRNRVSLLFGDESCGKTLLSLYAIIDAQRRDPNSYQVFIDAEGSFDPVWAKHLGVDVKRIVYAGPDSLEKAFDILIGMISDPKADVIVLDSIASQAPLVEIENMMDNTRVGVTAIQVNKALRKIQSAMNGVTHKPAIILINQVREKIGGYGDPTTLTGGVGQKFFSSMQIQLKKSTKEYDADKTTQLTQNVMWTIAKSKVSIAGRKGRYDLVIAGEDSGSIEVGDYLAAEAKSIGVLEQSGAWYTLHTGTEDVRIQGKAGLVEYFDLLTDLIITHAKKRGDLADDYQLTKMASRRPRVPTKSGNEAGEEVSEGVGVS